MPEDERIADLEAAIAALKEELVELRAEIDLLNNGND